MPKLNQKQKQKPRKKLTVKSKLLHVHVTLVLVNIKDSRQQAQQCAVERKQIQTRPQVQPRVQFLLRHLLSLRLQNWPLNNKKSDVRWFLVAQVVLLDPLDQQLQHLHQFKGGECQQLKLVLHIKQLSNKAQLINSGVLLINVWWFYCDSKQ